MESKPTKSYYKIGEVSAMLDVPVSTLRFWEDTFEQLDPFRTSGGTRKYRSEDVEMAKLIKYFLREKGYSLDYTKKKALADYRRYPPRHPFCANLSTMPCACSPKPRAVARTLTPSHGLRLSRGGLRVFARFN